jgi:hypothetical protein
MAFYSFAKQSQSRNIRLNLLSSVDSASRAAAAAVPATAAASIKAPAAASIKARVALH